MFTQHTALAHTPILTTLLKRSKNIAIIGAKEKQGQPVDMVGRYLIDHGYSVYPVHPTRKNVWGLQTYSTLTEIEQHLDIVNLFRASEYCLEHAHQVLALSHAPQCFWVQLGIRAPQAQALLAKTPIVYVEDMCIKIVHEHSFATPANT